MTTLSGAVLGGTGLVAAATVAGAGLVRRRPGQRQSWFAAAAGVLLIIAGLHLLPDAWADAQEAEIWLPLVPMAAVAAFVAAGLAARVGCGCRERRELVAGTGMTIALAIHRFMEGAAIALTGSVAVALALAAHAFGEGMATGALLSGQPRRRVAGCLALMCVSPVLGAVVADAFPVPEAAEPVLVATAAGVLAQAALISLRAAFRGLRPHQLLVSRPAAVTATAAVVTVLAVYGVG
jgi:ZIP family zinc transporter